MSPAFKLDPEIFITFHPSFLSYAANLKAKKKLTDQETHLLSSVDLLTTTIATDYRLTLAKIKRLTDHGEITFDLLYSILVPGEIMVATCSITGLPRLFHLASWTRVAIEGKPMYQLNLESVDLVDRPLTKDVIVGRVQSTVFLKAVRGTVRIDSFDAYPLKFHQNEKAVREAVMKRGNKWVSLIGLHHMQYDGLAALKCGDKFLRHSVGLLSLFVYLYVEPMHPQVKSRIMVDRATFRRLNPNYVFPTPVLPKVEENPDPAGNNRFNPNPMQCLSMQYDYGSPIPLPIVPTQNGD